MKDILLVALAAGNFLLINIDLIKRRASGLDRNCNCESLEEVLK